ncbi:MAG TPA: electron transfer flavoprotein subunit alpha/FixB family protein [Thermodesulfobacteriota bacterium]|nr:electron transfer flavoprotein subunit alpha/FixB family protein [Thermodesulfobacteriota bacterium]
MSEYKNILIYSEASKDTLSSEGKELLGGARKLADSIGEQVLCLIAGKDASSAAAQAIAYGADTVLCVSDGGPDGNREDALCQILEHVVKTYLPRVLLVSQKNVDVATRLGFKLDTGVCTDCVNVEMNAETKQITQTRSVYGGAARGVFTTRNAPQISCVRAKALSPLEYDGSRQGTIEPVQVPIDPGQFRTRTVSEVKEEGTAVKVENASIIVCGGRGLGGPEPFNTVLKNLADALGGVVGSSRPPADNGWVSKALHIGLTGKIVAPSLYVAIAVSGASQHMAGCSGSKTIVAINNDREAAIFRECDYGVVGPYEEVVPALTKKLIELKNQKTA